jgi:hypothetical protein
MFAPWSRIALALPPLGRDRRRPRTSRRRYVPDLGALEERAYLSTAGVAMAPTVHAASTTVKFPGGFVNTHHGTRVKFPGGFVITLPGSSTRVNFPGGLVNSSPGSTVVNFPGGFVTTNHGGTVVSFPGGSFVLG